MTSQITGADYITIEEAKEQLSIDPGLTTHDQRISRIIGGAIDWAENFTQRSLGELMELNSPTDSSATPLPNPVDSPRREGGFWWRGDWVDTAFWQPDDWHRWWQKNPVSRDDSHALRRDVKEAILLKIQCLFDRNTDEMDDLERAAKDMLWPYRQGLGV